MRIIVCGDRHFTNAAYLFRELDRLDAVTPGGIRCVIEGAADDVVGLYISVDYWANQWALARGRSAVRHHAEWKKLGRAAGPIRNGRMLEIEKPDAVIALPGGPGTADMVRQAHKAGVRVIEIS